MRRVHAWIRGEVQGVFYRSTCARTAERLGVAGWVRNAPDGSVEAVFEGPAGAVEEIVTWCREGPSGARVDEVRVRDEPPTGEHGFRVTR
jgi:acylphosphatase